MFGLDIYVLEKKFTKIGHDIGGMRVYSNGETESDSIFVVSGSSMADMY